MSAISLVVVWSDELREADDLLALQASVRASLAAMRQECQDVVLAVAQQGLVRTGFPGLTAVAATSLSVGAWLFARLEPVFVDDF